MTTLKEFGKYDFEVSAAGRVNIIGEHVDYCGGKVFPAALSVKNTVYVRKNGTDKINLCFTDLPDKISMDINKLEDYKGLKFGNYQAGSALMWKNAGHKIVGCDMLQDCTVPFGSGLSSSAAIEVSTIAALAAVAGEKIDKVEVALLAQKAEREYAGMNCGIMDQYASACGKKGQAMLLDCKTLECKYVDLELGDYSLVIINTKKPHNLVESKYNERREQTEKALELLQTRLDVTTLADITPEQFEQNKDVLDEILEKRARHVVYECDRVNKAVTAMAKGDIIELGKLLQASHKSLSELYEVTGFELDTLAGLANAHPACIGSRMTGGGFGGCTISLVKTEKKDEFIKDVTAKYEQATTYKPAVYQAEIADGIIVK